MKTLLFLLLSTASFAQLTISQYPAASALGGTEIVIGNQPASGAGATKKITINQIATFVWTSSVLTGTPTAPTQSAGNNSTRLATTAYVDAKVVEAIANGATGIAPSQDVVFDALALKSNLASPTFTGTPAAPTASAATNTTQIATTAFVTTADNLKSNLASPTFTGTPAAPTASPGTNTTQLATTAFVVANNLAGTAAYVVDRATPSTAGGTITLDMNSQIQRLHIGSATFAGPKTIAMSNTTNSLGFTVLLEVTNVAAVLTMPADWKMSSGDFNGTTWTPPTTGQYEFGGRWYGAFWSVSVTGPLQ